MACFIIFLLVCFLFVFIQKTGEVCGCLESSEEIAAKKAAAEAAEKERARLRRLTEEKEERTRIARIIEKWRIAKIIEKWGDLSASSVGEALMEVMSKEKEADALWRKFDAQLSNASKFSGSQLHIAKESLRPSVTSLEALFSKAVLEKAGAEKAMVEYVKTGVARVVEGDLDKDSYDKACTTLGDLNRDCNKVVVYIGELAQHSKRKLDLLG